MREAVEMPTPDQGDQGHRQPGGGRAVTHREIAILQAYAFFALLTIGVGTLVGIAKVNRRRHQADDALGPPPSEAAAMSSGPEPTPPGQNWAAVLRLQDDVYARPRPRRRRTDQPAPSREGSPRDEQ